MYESRAKINLRYFPCDRSSSIPAKTATGLLNALACPVASAKERLKKRQCRTSARPLKVMSSLFSKMACLSHQSGLTQFCLPYDQVASDLGARLCCGSWQSRLSIKRQQGSHIILRRDVPFAQVVVPDHKELDTGTLRGILRQAGLSADEFRVLI